MSVALIVAQEWTVIQMAEYIDKYEAYTLLKDLEAAYIYPPVKEAYATAARRIDQIKPTDVQPVKRGKWEEELYNDCFHCYRAICSECGGESTDFYSITDTHNFCEYCGARMTKDGDIE